MPRVEPVAKSARLSGGLMRMPRFAQIAVDWKRKLVERVAMIGGMRSARMSR